MSHLLSPLAARFAEGGPFMWPILACALCALFLAARRLLRLLRMRADAAALYRRVERLVRRGQLDLAIQACNRQPQAAVPGVLKAALLHGHLRQPQVENAVEEAKAGVRARLGRGLPLMLLGTVAMLCGLLGTIEGLMISFDAVAKAPTAMEVAAVPPEAADR